MQPYVSPFVLAQQRAAAARTKKSPPTVRVPIHGYGSMSGSFVVTSRRPEKSTCTHADAAGFGGCRAEQGAHEKKAEADGRSGVRVGLARALSAHRVTKDRSRAIFLKFVDVVTAAGNARNAEGSHLRHQPAVWPTFHPTQ